MSTKITVETPENDEDWEFVFVCSNGKKVMAVF
jgi:hypothetical protein